MAEVSITGTQISDTLWQISWTPLGTGLWAWVYRNGRLMAKTLADFCYVSCETSHDIVEVFDSESDVPTAALSVSVPRLQWERDDTATSYRVEQYVDSAWAALGYVPGGGPWTCQYYCSEVTEAGLYEYRIVPIVDGVDGIPQAFSFYLTPPPEREDYAATYDDDTGIMSFDNA